MIIGNLFVTIGRENLFYLFPEKEPTDRSLGECYRPFPSRLRISTARRWRCAACRPVDELAAKLQKTLGRDLTDEERLRYGVPEELSLQRNKR